MHKGCSKLEVDGKGLYLVLSLLLYALAPKYILGFRPSGLGGKSALKK